MAREAFFIDTHGADKEALKKSFLWLAQTCLKQKRPSGLLAVNTLRSIDMGSIVYDLLGDADDKGGHSRLLRGWRGGVVGQ